MRTRSTSFVMVAIAAGVGWCLLLLSICTAADNPTHSSTPQDPDASKVVGIINLLVMPPFSVLTPYMNSSQIRSIPEAYSEDASAPWGFEHRGIDFSPNVQLASFQAAFSGVIEVVDLHENVIDPDTSYWHVNVKLVHDAVWSAWYAFEPMTESQTDAIIQLWNLAVSEGYYLQAGDFMGKLHAPTAGAHVHFTLNKNDVAVCPEFYFTPQARQSVLDIIHKDHPTWDMCY